MEEECVGTVSSRVDNTEMYTHTHTYTHRIVLDSSGEVCMCVWRKGCWGCGPPERKIGNNVSARVKSKYLQGFNLHWEQ